jgi:murein DD-endopeptidase MepM/ murein hydrolase activator NlpD
MKLSSLARCIALAALIGVWIWPAPAWAQEGCPAGGTYTVQRGDTLYRIARLQATSVSELVRLNNLANPNWLYAGQVLVLPGAAGCQSQPATEPAAPAAAPAATASVYVVQRGDTLSRIAARNGITVGALVAANDIADAARIYVGQRLVLASAPQVAATDTPGTSARVASLSPAVPEQGRTLSISVPAANLASVTGALGDWPLQFFLEGDRYVSLLGVQAFASPGEYRLTLNLTDQTGNTSAVSQPVTVAPGGYASERIVLNTEKSALLEPALQAAERAQVGAVVAPSTPVRHWQGLFQMPAGGRVTSWFGTRRSYNGGPFSSYHDGVDLSVAGGWNVVAPAPGIVVLAQALTVRGNVIIIDHGWGVYSGFWHQSALAVRVGEVVQAGQVIGTIGNTGLSTGAHLHWALFVGGVSVDPLQWTRQVFP